ncbi:MAG TPA: LysM peptidoglycan-binding domain-containing protein, partial [Candidatus Choladousia intestinavium]|nr:LysM peptidoglycan-binding domain-containing protein [Candidatus Choladousia intestinavium]
MQQEPCMGFIHIVQKGENLYRIGKQYQVSVSALIYANPFVDVYSLQIGDELCIPKL